VPDRSQALHYRRKYRGLISLDSKLHEVDSHLLSVIYTPGVAQPCRAIAECPEKSFTHSGRGNTVAIVSDGSSALGLGNVGPEATMPILESKAVFFKKMAGLNAQPLCLDTEGVDDFVKTVERLSSGFGAISIEDVASPRCFEIEERLKSSLDVPVMHNDQHGTAITALSILHNVCRLQPDRRLENLKIAMTGAGAAGVATVRLLSRAGVRRITLCDENGVIHENRDDLNPAKSAILPYLHNPVDGPELKDAVRGSDVFIGLSVPDILSGEMVQTMAKDPVIIAGAAPNPEISPEEAHEAGASIVCTARFDYPNMVTDALALPGMFRGVIETGSSRFTDSMKLEAARVIAECVSSEDLRPRAILPDLLDLNVGPSVARSSARRAVEDGVARRDIDPDAVESRTRHYIYEGDPVEFSESFWSGIDNPVENNLGLEYYRSHRGPLTTRSKIALKDREIFGLLYIPGLGEVVKEIRDDRERVFRYSARGNMVAVATNGSAVLGLGDIGVPAALPVMEGKSVIFKTFAGLDAFPICIDDDGDSDQFVRAMKRLEPTLGGVNLEDISAPNCFEIERRLKKELDVPVFHDDQHGTAVVILSGLKNALEIRNKPLSESQIVINGAGASAIATARILKEAGVREITMCDSKGIIYSGRGSLNEEKRKIAEWTNPRDLKGELSEALSGADVFIGLSVADILTAEGVRTMASEPIVFALANPDPEILPDQAYEGGACVVATGRSDFPNQVNNAIAFPGIFRGAMDVQATQITEGMKLAASDALSDLVREHGVRRHYILPKAMDFRTAPEVARAVAEQAIREGVAKREVDPETIKQNTRDYIYEGRLFYIP